MCGGPLAQHDKDTDKEYNGEFMCGAPKHTTTRTQIESRRVSLYVVP